MKMYLPPAHSKSSRRSLLKRGIFGGALLSLGGLGVLGARGSFGVPTPPQSLLVLSPREYAVIVALAERFIPARQGFHTPAQLGTAVACDRVISLLDPTAQVELKQLLMLFENAVTNLVFGGRPTPFTAMTAPEQERVLHDWAHSMLALRRSGYNALRSLVMATHYGNPKTWASAGYAGPPAGHFDPNASVWRGGDTPRSDSEKLP